MGQIAEASLNLEQLQEQKNFRDADVQKARQEMGIIHALMQPIWDKEQRDTAGPAHLRQGVGVDMTHKGGIQ